MTVRSRTTLALLGGIALGVAATMTGAVLADREPSQRDELVASRAAAVHRAHGTRQLKGQGMLDGRHGRLLDPVQGQVFQADAPAFGGILRRSV